MKTLIAAVSAAGLCCLFALSSHAEERPVRVGGYFCESDKDQVAFLTKKAEGENDIKAANTVNKALGRQSCADYIAVYIIHRGEEVVMANGLLFKIHKVTLLPEKVEMWTGSLMSSLEVANRMRGT